MFFLLLSAAANAQALPPILSTGDAAVAGFSGVRVLGSPASDAQRIDNSYINLDGASLASRSRSASMGEPPQGQFITVAKPFSVSAGQIGQVFSLDARRCEPAEHLCRRHARPMDCRSSFPTPTATDAPDRARRGAPNAAFMPGLFGPVLADGGPGSIWRIDGSTGAVRAVRQCHARRRAKFRTGARRAGVRSERRARSFAADRDTGMIHRFTLDGAERGRFDHGVAGLVGRARLPPVAVRSAQAPQYRKPGLRQQAIPRHWALVPAG